MTSHARKSLVRFKVGAALALLLGWTACTTEPGVNPDEIVVTIGPAGGTLVSRDSLLTVTIPAGAVSGPTDITIRPIAPGDLPAQFAGMDIAGAYEVGPSGLVFSAPLTVRLLSDQVPTQTDSSFQFVPENLLTLGSDTVESLDSARIETSGDSLFIVAELWHFSPVVRVRQVGSVTMTLVLNPGQAEVGQAITAFAMVQWNPWCTPGFGEDCNEVRLRPWVYWDHTWEVPNNPVSFADPSGNGRSTFTVTGLGQPQTATIRYECRTVGRGIVRILYEYPRGFLYPSVMMSKGVGCLALPDKQLAVALTGNGGGTVASNPPGIACASDCDELFPHGTTVTLTANANTGSKFVAWSGHCAGTNPATAVVTDQDRSCTAQFDALPTISSLQPTTVTAGGGDFQLTVNGNYFIQNRSTIGIGSITLSTTYVSAQQLQGTVPAAEIATAGTKDVTVTTQGVGTSAPATLTVANPVLTITALNPTSAVAGGSSFILEVTGVGMAPSAFVSFGGTLVATAVIGSIAHAEILASMIATPGTVAVTVTNPGGGTSNALDFQITSPADPCTTPAALQYGTQLDGTLGPGDCTATFGSNKEYYDLFSVTTTQSANTLQITGTSQAYAVIGDANVDYADVFSFGSAASALVFLPPGSPFVVVGSNTGTDPQRTYSVLVGPASSDVLANCGTAFARPGVSLTQTLAQTDCFGFNRYDPNAGVTRYDYVNLNLGAGEAATITMSSTAFDPVVMATCTNDVGQTRTFTDDNSGGGTSARLVITSTNYEQCRVELSSRGDNRGPIVGAYTASIQP